MCRNLSTGAFFSLLAAFLILAQLPMTAIAQSLPPANSAQQWGVQGASPQSQPASHNDCTDDAMIVFDGSTSMGNPGYKEDIPRIIEARKAMRQVLPAITRLRKLGLIVFGPGPKDVCHNVDYRLAPALGNSSQIIGELDRLQPEGNTPLTHAVEKAANLLDYRNRPAVVVLVTDGDETCGGDPCKLAADLVKSGKAITVHVIGFKGLHRYYKFPANDTGLKVYTQARCIADTTGGKFITAQTTEELEAALKQTLGCPFVTGVY